MTVAQVTEPLALRRVYGNFPSGVAALAAVVEGKPVGLAVSSFTPASLSPPLVLVCVAHTSTTWPLLTSAPRLGVSVLSALQEQACQQLSARSGDRFANVAWRPSEDGAVFIDGASAWFECSIQEQRPAGDHDIVVLAVHDLDGDHATAPLVFHGSRLHGLHLEPPTDVEAADLRASNLQASQVQARGPQV